MVDVNAKAANFLKGSHKRNQTHCKRGHPLDFTRLEAGKLVRRCRVCEREKNARGGEISPQILKKVKELIQAGRPISSFTTAGKPGYIVRHVTLLRHRRENPAFGKFVADAIVDSNSRAQQQRHAHRHFVSASPAVQSRYYRIISEMVPRYLPDHDDIVSDIFQALLEGSLRHADVARRVSFFVAERHRMFPSKYAIRSLDAPAYQEGATPLIETVSNDLWDRHWETDESPNEYG
ncbi:hypothetical protein J2W51_002308 [Tardiphaga robiniae]|uniref:hypothetical protein n=1 Tax=Tardiphaga robiniae TaxID=943830 RepID=UPI00285F30FF|nr:hypothetical protein [Tardiphaga robiniae]MDR6659738.1 hypothetical protein [Tardiphaga robiniae]